MNKRKTNPFPELTRTIRILTALFLTVFHWQSAKAATSPASPRTTPNLTAKEIMQKNDEARRVSDFWAKAVLITGTEGAVGDKIKNFTLWRKVQNDQIHNSTLTRFQHPTEVKNEGILIVENQSGRNDVLMYLPNFKKIRRVESQQQSGSFMGSAFSYSDIATPHVEDYGYEHLKDEACPSAEASSMKCAVIECVPANEDIKERTGYAKSVLWVRMDNFMFVHAEYYNLTGTLFKKLDAKDIKLVDAKSQKWVANHVSIHNLQTKEFTDLKFSDVLVNSGLPESTFTQQNLQKVN